LVARIRTGPVVGHNVTFDLGMLQAEIARLGSGLPRVPYVCTFNLAYALALDTPSNRLGVLCRALGVPMENWHTALADAEAAGRLLFRLIAEAQARHAGHLLAVSLYPGPATAWPALPYCGRVLERDPRVLPPTGDQPDEVLGALLGSAPPVASVAVKLEVMSMLPPEANQKLARALAEAKAARATADSAKTDDQRLAERQQEAALDAAQRDWERGGSTGEPGLSRLQAIVAAFADGDEEDELAEASLLYAELLRYTPGHGTAEVDAAYRAAYQVATRADTASGDGGIEVDEQGGTKRILDIRFPYPGANDVLDKWSAFALARRDMRLFLELAPERRRGGGEAFVYSLGRYLTQLAVVERSPEEADKGGQRPGGSLGRPGRHNGGGRHHRPAGQSAGGSRPAGSSAGRLLV
jgi:DNA polymerase III epsilon subunit-like protein